MGSSVKDAHLHIENEDSKTEKPGIWSASFAFSAVRRSTVVDEVCRCHARPAERSGLLARSPREIISTCWSHPSTASAPTSHDVHEGGWTSERLWSIRCTGRLCSHCGWQSDPARSAASRPCTGASRTRYMTAKCGPDHRSMAPAYRQACSHGQHWRLRRDPAGQRGRLACCGPRRVALPTAVRTKSACAPYAPQSFRGPSAFMDIM